jgi:hypothetical protein
VCVFSSRLWGGHSPRLGNSWMSSICVTQPPCISFVSNALLILARHGHQKHVFRSLGRHHCPPGFSGVRARCRIRSPSAKTSNEIIRCLRSELQRDPIVSLLAHQFDTGKSVCVAVNQHVHAVRACTARGIGKDRQLRAWNFVDPCDLGIGGQVQHIQLCH